MTPRPPGYAEFLERLRGYERFEPLPRSRGPDKLDAVRRLADELGHPERHGRVVHVAGTNGKGMTAAMIARLLQSAGHRTGLYTSPHVLDVRERIVLDGAPIAPPLFAQAGHCVLDVADRLRVALHFSYFDLLTLIAWTAFRAEGLQWIVLETGLGGLSDATNIGPKELAVLTRIGLDHMHVLGDTLEAIATQKLGIVPPGVPVVLAEQAPALGPWMHRWLTRQGSPVLPADGIRLAPDPAQDDALLARWGEGPPLRVELPGQGWRLTAPRLACAATALVAGGHLLGACAPAEQEARLRTVLATHLPGRLELRRNQGVRGVPGAALALLVLDGGHNAEALAALDVQLRRWGVEDYTLILGLQRDKLVDSLRAPVAALLSRAQRVLTLVPRTARAPDPAELRVWLEALLPARQSGAPALAVESVPDAVAALAAALETPARPVVVTGSFWMLGDVMGRLADAPAGEGGSGTQRG